MLNIESFEAQTKDEEAVIRSLRRAYDEQVHLKFWSLKSINGETTGWYESLKHIVYIVRLDCCQCLAGQHGQFCKHRAALADLAGTLDQLIPAFYSRLSPEPTDPISAARAEVARIQGFAKSTADFYALENARAVLASLMESGELVAA